MATKKKPWIVGETEIISHDSVKPNDWNPNRMTPEKYEAVKTTLQERGWLLSESLLVWGTDQKGVKKYLIIDGEHRWKAAQELGIKEVPVVFVNGITQTEAKRLTVQLDNHGENNSTRLVDVIKSLRGEFSEQELAKEFGFNQDFLKSVLSEPKPVVLDDLTSKNPVTKTVPLYYNAEQHKQFTEEVSWLATHLQKSTVSDVVIAVLEHQCRKV